MKIRSGFVSNSSSSSFIIAYDTTKVTHDPEEVYSLITEDPDINILFVGSECGEGEDIFILTDSEKSIIRRFKKEFIKKNRGSYSKLVDITPEKGCVYTPEPKITAYYGEDARLIYDSIIDGASIHVDMSNVNLYYDSKLTAEEYLALPKDKRDEIDKYYEINRQREVEARHRYTEDKINEYTHGNVKAELKEVSFDRCDDDYTFKERYITGEDSQEYDTLTRHYIDEEESIYTLIYESVTTEASLDQVKEILNNRGRYNNCYITRYDDALDNDPDMDLYELGDIEAQHLIDSTARIWEGDTSFKVFTNLHIIKNGDRIDNVTGTVSTYSGRLAVIDSKQAIKDFDETFVDKPALYE